MKPRSWPVYGAILALLWLFLRGVALRPVPIVEELLLGLALGLPIAFGLRRLYPDRTNVSRVVRAIPFAVLYTVAFLTEVLTANIDVARRLLSPSMPIEPDVIVIPLRVESDIAITTIANSITLTPGTLTMDYGDDRNVLYVHAIDASDRQAVLDPIRTWEDYALVIFDETGQPGDPVPDPDEVVGDDE
jgi:multicomponent Na+:H+ antiporter subunit E